MGVVTNIIEAIRRIGSPSQKAALKRLDAGLEGRQVVSIKRGRLDDPSGAVPYIEGTTLPVPEAVLILTAEEVAPLQENAQYGLNFLRAFGVQRGAAWTLEDLDLAFAAWQRAGDKSTFSDDYVMEVLGAMFGEYCIKHLNMRWIKLTDDHGSTLAVEGIAIEFRGFPFQSISKRIRDAENFFFQSIFLLMRKNSVEGNERARERPNTSYMDSPCK